MDRDQPYDVDEQGWARCAHTDEDRQALRDQGYLSGLSVNELIENLVFSERGAGSITIDADQWFGIGYDGWLWTPDDGDPIRVKYWIQADNMELGLTELLHRLETECFDRTGQHYGTVHSMRATVRLP